MLSGSSGLKFYDDALPQKEVFSTDFSGHDFHTLRVQNGRQNCARRGANQEIVALAALLHDVDDIKLSRDACDRAVTFLSQHAVDEARLFAPY